MHALVQQVAGQKPVAGRGGPYHSCIIPDTDENTVAKGRAAAEQVDQAKLA
jgi:hypothetical protein